MVPSPLPHAAAHIFRALDSRLNGLLHDRPELVCSTFQETEGEGSVPFFFGQDLFLRVYLVPEINHHAQDDEYFAETDD